MPVKKRRSKRRIDPAAEAEAWACVFATGGDFYGDAADFSGLTEPSDVWPREARPEAAKAWQAAARDAWRRVGRIFLDRDMGAAFNVSDHALHKFGEPESCR